MFVKIRELSTRTAVAVQTETSSRSSESSLKATLRSGRTRAELAVGAVMSYLVYASSTYTAFAQGSKKTGDAASGLISLINTFTTFLIIVLAAGSLLMGVFAALQFVGSGGNTKVIENAKRTIKNVVIGLVVAAGIFIIKGAIIKVVGAPGVDGGEGRSIRNQLETGGGKLN